MRSTRLDRFGSAIQAIVGLKSVHPHIYNAIGSMCVAYTTNQFHKLCGMPIDNRYNIPDTYDVYTHIAIAELNKNYWFDEQRQAKRFQILSKLLSKHDIALMIRPIAPTGYRSNILLLPNPEFVNKVVTTVGSYVHHISPRIDRLDGAFCMHDLSFDQMVFFINNFDRYTIFTEMDTVWGMEGLVPRFYAKEKIQDKKKIILDVLKGDRQVQGRLMNLMDSPLKTVRETLGEHEHYGLDLECKSVLLNKIHDSNSTIRREQENIAECERALAICEEFAAGKPSFDEAYYEHLYEYLSDNFPTMLDDREMPKLAKLATFLAASTI